MKFRNKGRKIYKTKEKNYYGKSPAGKFLSGALSVLLIGGICVLGYSAAGPLFDYTRKKGDSNSNPTETTSADVSVITPTSENLVVPENMNIEQFKAAAVLPSDLADIESLRAALSNLTAQYGAEYIVVPLKVSGGELYYASQVYEAQMSGAIKSTLTLGDITYEIRAAGFKPAAEISVLRDNLLPLTYPESGYRTIDDGSRWIDNDAESGGKPWISPFSESAQTYIYSICDEIAAADFDKVICSDMIFPPFRETDLTILGEEVNSSERYLQLTSMVNQMYSKMMSGGSVMMLEVSAADILVHNDEVIQPMLLDTNMLIVNIDLDELGKSITYGGSVYEFSGTPSENASKAFGLVQHKLADYNVVVRVSGESVSKAELAAAKDEIALYGYNSFIIG